MRTIKLSVSFLVLLTALVFTNCTKDHQENYKETTREIITEGKWSVDYFFAGQDITSHYNNYQFEFLGNGSLTAFINNQQLSGTWNMIRDIDRNDVLQIHINSGDPSLAELNNEWNVTDKSFVKVSMKGGDSQLRFKKL